MASHHNLFHLSLTLPTLHCSSQELPALKLQVPSLQVSVQMVRREVAIVNTSSVYLCCESVLCMWWVCCQHVVSVCVVEVTVVSEGVWYVCMECSECA